MLSLNSIIGATLTLLNIFSFISRTNAIPLEIGESRCKIVTDKFVATAEASLSKVLYQFPNYSDVKELIDSIKLDIKNDIGTIKQMILDLNEQLHHQPALLDLRRNRTNRSDYYRQTEIITKKLFGSRNEEINKFNSTSYVNKNGLKIFEYYWKANLSSSSDFADISKIGDSPWSIRSPMFYIFPRGYRMSVRLKYHNDNFLLYAGVTKGDYDQILRWPFNLKYKISILDQSSNDIQDIMSFVKNPETDCRYSEPSSPSIDMIIECLVMSFDKTILSRENYIVNQYLLVKFIVFLE